LFASAGAINVISATSGVEVSLASAPALNDLTFLKISVPSGLSDMTVSQTCGSGNSVQLVGARGFLPDTQFLGYTPIRWRSTLNSGASATWVVFNTPSETYDYFVTVANVAAQDYPINITLTVAPVINAQTYNYSVVPDGNPVVLYSGNSSFLAGARYAAFTFVPKTQFDSISSVFITSTGMANINGFNLNRYDLIFVF
jgi:hypothetical protein